MTPTRWLPFARWRMNDWYNADRSPMHLVAYHPKTWVRGRARNVKKFPLDIRDEREEDE